MEQKKIPFFKRLKNAIVNFDEYQNFSQEKLGTAIKYFLKLMLIFSILISYLKYRQYFSGEDTNFYLYGVVSFLFLYFLILN